MPDKNDQLNKFIDSRIREGMYANQQWSELWIDALDYIFNNQLAGVDSRDGWERIQANYIYPAVEQTNAILAKRRPTILATPYEPLDIDKAKQWQSLLAWQFANDLQMAKLLEDAAMDCAIFGYCVTKSFWEHKPRGAWDPVAHRWVGRPQVTLLHPTYFGGDPDAETFDAMSYSFCRRQIRVDRAKWRWPAYAEEIDNAARHQDSDLNRFEIQGFGDGGYSVDSRTSGQKGIGVNAKPNEGRLVALLRSLKTRGVETETTGEDGLAQSNYTTIEELYWLDPEEHKEKLEESYRKQELLEGGAIYEEAGQYKVGDPAFFKTAKTEGDLVMESDWPNRIVEEWDEPRFPNGRYALRIGGSSGVILNPKEEEQVYPYRKWPFAICYNAALPHVWQGLNSVEMGKGLQDYINTTLAHQANHVKLFGDPVVIVEEGAIAGAEDNKGVARKLKAVAGAIWKVTKGGIDRVRREPAPQMGNALTEFYALLAQELRDQTGVQDVALGRSKGSGETATEVVTRDTNSRLRIGHKSILQDRFIIGVMERTADLDQLHMSPGDKARITGDGPTRITLEEDMLALDFDVTLDAGTALPFDEERKQERYEVALGHVGPAMLPEYLDVMKIEEKDVILARHEAWQQFEQFLAAQEQMQQGQPGAGAAPQGEAA